MSKNLGLNPRSNQLRCCCSVAKSCPTVCDPMYSARQASLSFTISQSQLKFMSIESLMPSNHLILCRPLLLLLSGFPSIRVFSGELALRIKWPKYCTSPLSLFIKKTVDRRSKNYNQLFLKQTYFQIRSQSEALGVRTSVQEFCRHNSTITPWQSFQLVPTDCASGKVPFAGQAGVPPALLLAAVACTQWWPWPDGLESLPGASVVPLLPQPAASLSTRPPCLIDLLENLLLLCSPSLFVICKIDSQPPSVCLCVCVACIII